MTTTELIRSIDRIRDDLNEVKRYVRHVDPVETQSGIENACIAIRMLRCPGLVIGLLANRLADNLKEASKFIQVEPHILEGYIDGARFELLALSGRIEKAAGEGGGAR